MNQQKNLLNGSSLTSKNKNTKKYELQKSADLFQSNTNQHQIVEDPKISSARRSAGARLPPKSIMPQNISIRENALS
jgi:hypothetical protein